MSSRRLTYLTASSLVATAVVVGLACGTAAAATPAHSGPAGAPAAGVGTLIAVAANSDHVAVSPNGSYAYVASATENVVSVIDLHTDQVVKVIAVGRGPVAVAFNSAGTYAYVTNTEAGTVSVVDTETMAVTATLPIGSGQDALNAIAVNSTATGDRIYVAAEQGHTVHTYDLATHRHGTIRVQDNPSALVIADGQLVVGQAGIGHVDLINLKTDRVAKRLMTPQQSGVVSAAAIPLGHDVAMTGNGYTEWLDLDTDTFSPALVAGAPGNLTGVAASVDGQYTFIATADYPDAQSPADGTITTVDNATHQVIKVVTVGQFPWSIAVTGQVAAVPNVPNHGPADLQVISLSELA